MSSLFTLSRAAHFLLEALCSVICEVEPCTLRAEGMKVIWSMMTSQLETKALPIKVGLGEEWWLMGTRSLVSREQSTSFLISCTFGNHINSKV